MKQLKSDKNRAELRHHVPEEFLMKKYDPNTSLQYSKNLKLTHSPKNGNLHLVNLNHEK